MPGTLHPVKVLSFLRGGEAAWGRLLLWRVHDMLSALKQCSFKSEVSPLLSPPYRCARTPCNRAHSRAAWLIVCMRLRLLAPQQHPHARSVLTPGQGLLKGSRRLRPGHPRALPPFAEAPDVGGTPGDGGRAPEPRPQVPAGARPHRPAPQRPPPLSAAPCIRRNPGGLCEVGAVTDTWPCRSS